MVNVASGVGRLPQPGSAVYAATKHGVVALTESLRLEYRESGVGSSLIHPGYIPTAMVAGTQSPSRLLPQATPEDCARAIVDAVQRDRFEVWVPSRSWIGVKAGNLVGRRVRERVLIAIGLGKIATETDESARRSYHDRAFGSDR